MARRSDVLAVLAVMLAVVAVVDGQGLGGGRKRAWKMKGRMFAMAESRALRTANISYTFVDPIYQNVSHRGGIEGRYGLGSDMGNVTGIGVHVLTENGGNDGCLTGVNLPSDQDWVALIQRGNCRFTTKVENHVIKHTASAVLIYNDRDDDELVDMQLNQNYSDTVAVFIRKDDGDLLAALLDSRINISLTILHAPTTNATTTASPDFFRKWRSSQPDMWGVYGMLVFLVIFCVLLLLAGVAGVVWKTQIWRHPRSLFKKSTETEEPVSNYKHLEETRS